MWFCSGALGRRAQGLGLALSFTLGGAALAVAQNSPPDAVFLTTPGADPRGILQGESPFTVEFNLCRSSDPDPGDQLKFTYDFDGDGGVDSFGHCRQSVTYRADPGQKVCYWQDRQPRVCVWDRQPGADHEVCRSYDVCVTGSAEAASGAKVGRFLYTSNQGGNSLSGFAIDPATGALSPLSPFTYGLAGYSLYISSNDAYIYAPYISTGGGGIAVFAVGGNGVLTPRPTTISFPPIGLVPALTLEGGYAYSGVVTATASAIASFAVGSDGSLAALTGVLVGNYPLLSKARDGKLYTTDYVGSVLVHDLGPAGSLTAATPASVPTGGVLPAGLVFDPAGKFLFVCNQGSNTVAVLPVGSGGTLGTATSFSTSGSAPTIPVVDPSGRYLYVSNAGSGTIAGFEIGSTGALTPLPGSPFAAGAGPVGLVVEPAGRYLYAATYASNAVSGFRIAANGALVPTVPATFPAGAGAVDVLVVP